MKTKKLNIFDISVTSGVTNEYPTSIDQFRSPPVWMIVGVRTSGKSFLLSRYLAQCHRENVYDKIYFISPSFSSNKKYFGKYVKEEDVYFPTNDSIHSVMCKVEADRDEWEKYLAEY